MTMEGEIESPPVLWPPARTPVMGVACAMTALSQRAAPVTIRGSACRRASWFAVPLVVGRSVCAGDRKVAKALQPLEVAQAFHQAG